MSQRINVRFPPQIGISLNERIAIYKIDRLLYEISIDIFIG
jgi:hypothetical protein